MVVVVIDVDEVVVVVVVVDGFLESRTLPGHGNFRLKLKRVKYMQF